MNGNRVPISQSLVFLDIITEKMNFPHYPSFLGPIRSIKKVQKQPFWLPYRMESEHKQSNTAIPSSSEYLGEFFQLKEGKKMIHEKSNR